MSQIKYVHVIEFDDGERNIRPGKGSRDGTFVAIPTPDNNREDFKQLDWERVDYWRLPEPMPKSEFKVWWNGNVDDDPQPEPIPAVLDAMGRGDGGDS